MTYAEILQLCADRKEIPFLYKITKVIAESDSIGEGWSYCRNYDEERFKREKDRLMQGKDEGYLSAGLDIYELYLQEKNLIINF